MVAIMTAPLDFYFDFSSPYAYIAAMRIDALAAKHGRAVNWHPMLLAFAFKAIGTQPLVQYPIKGDYAYRDFLRSARELDIPLTLPEKFPIGTVTAARAVLWLKQHQPAQAVPFAKAIFQAYFVAGRDISAPEIVYAVAAELGIDAAALQAGCESDAIKAALKQSVDDAVSQRGVFGAPFIFADGEPFWGADRLDMLDRWLVRGGW